MLEETKILRSLALQLGIHHQNKIMTSILSCWANPPMPQHPPSVTAGSFPVALLRELQWVQQDWRGDDPHFTDHALFYIPLIFASNFTDSLLAATRLTMHRSLKMKQEISICFYHMHGSVTGLRPLCTLPLKWSQLHQDLVHSNMQLHAVMIHEIHHALS